MTGIHASIIKGMTPCHARGNKSPMCHLTIAILDTATSLCVVFKLVHMVENDYL